MRVEKRSYYEIVNDCVSESTAHGITYVFKRNEWYIKVAWLIFTLASTGVGFWLVVKSIIDYLGYETVTKAQSILETPAYFPTVTFCSQNSFTTDEAYQYVAKYIEDNDETPAEKLLNSSFFTTTDFLKYEYGVNLLANSIYTDTFRKSMGLNIEDAILVCYYNNNLCNDTEFWWYWDPYYG